MLQYNCKWQCKALHHCFYYWHTSAINGLQLVLLATGILLTYWPTTAGSATNVLVMSPFWDSLPSFALSLLYFYFHVHSIAASFINQAFFSILPSKSCFVWRKEQRFGQSPTKQSTLQAALKSQHLETHFKAGESTMCWKSKNPLLQPNLWFVWYARNRQALSDM